MDDYAKQTSPRENLIWAMPPLPLSSKPKKGLWRMANSGSVDLQKRSFKSRNYYQVFEGQNCK